MTYSVSVHGFMDKQLLRLNFQEHLPEAHSVIGLLRALLLWLNQNHAASGAVRSLCHCHQPQKPPAGVSGASPDCSVWWRGISETDFLKEKSLSASLSLLASPHISCLRATLYFIFPRLTAMKQYGYLLVLSSPDYVSIFSRFLSQLLSTHLLVSFQMFAKISDGLFILLSTYLYSCMLLPSSFLYCRLMGIQGGNFLCTVYYF